MWVLQSADADDDRPMIFRISPGAIKTIGRVAGVDFVVDAALISRVHCRLEARADAIGIVDLDSTNGVYINDARVERGDAQEGDRLRVGRIEFQISRTAID